jgi:hypothetical protein
MHISVLILLRMSFQAALRCVADAVEKDPLVAFRFDLDRKLMLILDAADPGSELQAQAQDVFTACVVRLVAVESLPDDPSSVVVALPGSEKKGGKNPKKKPPIKMSPRWRLLDVCKRVLAAQKLPSDATPAAVGQDEKSGANDEGSSFGSAKREFRWRAKAFAAEKMRHILDATEQARIPHEFDFGWADKHAPPCHFLACQLADLSVLGSLCVAQPFDPVKQGGYGYRMCLEREIQRDFYPTTWCTGWPCSRVPSAASKRPATPWSEGLINPQNWNCRNSEILFAPHQLPFYTNYP